MSKILLMREALVHDLTRTIEQNLEKYRGGDFHYLSSDSSNFIETDYEFNDEELAKIKVSDGDFNEVQCCLGAFNGLPNISAYLARDQRLWVYLTHIVLLDYTRQRWPIPQDKEKAIAHIKKHFFASGARGIERDNAISRLWWMASICSKVEGLTLEKSLTAFLYQSDVRANIVERPTTSQNVVLLSTVIKKLDQSFNGDKELYGREKFRTVMKELNLQGGIKLLEVLEPKEVERIVTRCATKG
jgi:Family of unknown function (DUF6339)